jgi:hypothetical protein
MILRFVFCFFAGVVVQASERIDFNELRLKQMAKVMNVRDYDLMLHTIHQFEVLDLACQKERQEQKIPLACLELDKKLSLAGVGKNSDLLLDVCNSRASELTDAEVITLLKNLPLLTQGCRNQVQERARIMTYKKSGKPFE